MLEVPDIGSFGGDGDAVEEDNDDDLEAELNMLLEAGDEELSRQRRG